MVNRSVSRHVGQDDTTVAIALLADVPLRPADGCRRGRACRHLDHETGGLPVSAPDHMPR